MGYSVIKSFEKGIDTRRMIDTTEAGALLDARDCHITRGGEIEKRAAFVITATFPAGTIGFYATKGPVFHTWGIGAAPAGMPPRGVYHDVQLPDDAATPSTDESTLTIAAILSVEEFGGKLYVIVKYSNGIVRHWYNDELLLTPGPPVTLTALVIAPRAVPAVPPQLDIPLPGPTPPSSPSPGKPQTSFYFSNFGIPALLQIHGVTMKSPGAPGTFSTTDYDEPGGTRRRLMPNMTDFNSTVGYHFAPGYVCDNDNVLFAQQVASLINTYDDLEPKVWATVAPDGKITVWVDKITPEFNGWELTVLTFFTSYIISDKDDPGSFIAAIFSGGIEPPIDPPPDPDETPGPDVPLDAGTFVLAHNEKLYATKQQLLNFTALKNPRAWHTTEGGGFIDHTMMGEGQPNLVSLADYGGDLAVFADRHIFIWKMDPDALKNFKRQVLHRTGTISPHSVTSFGQNEVMYLDRSGIRSLRQREANDAGFASDLGNNIDELVKAKIKATSVTQHERNFHGDVEPNSGRLWMALYDIIYVLSYFPGNRIAAWTWYDASTHPVDMLNANDEHIYWRSGDDVIVYGGEDDATYDDTEALVRAPYIDAGKPAHFKSWCALDAALYGTWQIRASFDPTAPTAFDLLANVTKSTYAQEKIAVNGKSPALSLELRSTFVGPARIGNAALHYEEDYSD